MPLSPQQVEQYLVILRNDLVRKSPDTIATYVPIVGRFLRESGDFSRQGVLTWMNNAGYCDNSIAGTVHPALKRLYKALQLEYPVDADDLPPKPDSEDLVTPTMEYTDVLKLIGHWKHYSGTYNTAVLFIATFVGSRAVEMTDAIIGEKDLTIILAKRKIHRNAAKPITRTHYIPAIYMPFLSGYEHLAGNTLRWHFTQICREAGVNIVDNQNWHSIRRALGTAFASNGTPEKLYKRFMHWAPNKQDMADLYFHVPFNDINAIILGEKPAPMTNQNVVHPFLKEWIK
jgi:hypothetical protein